MFRARGFRPGQPLTVEAVASDRPIPRGRVLGADWATPDRAACREEIDPVFPLNDKPARFSLKPDAPGLVSSGAWVAAHGDSHTVAPGPETPWATERSTATGYHAAGERLGHAVQLHLARQAKGSILP